MENESQVQLLARLEDEAFWGKHQWVLAARTPASQGRPLRLHKEVYCSLNLKSILKNRQF